MAEKNLRLQPWRYLFEVAYQLSVQGHEVAVVTDAEKPNMANLPVPTSHAAGKISWRQVSTINRYIWQKNKRLDETVAEVEPDVILWNLGLPSFAHQQFSEWPVDCPVLGIFAGLVYRPSDFYRLGMEKVIKGYKLSAIHVLGTLMPKTFLRNALNSGTIDQLVTQTDTTRQNLIELGVQARDVCTIGPGVDPIWIDSAATTAPDAIARRRDSLGFSHTDLVVIYFGSPAPLRGLHSLIKAIKVARQKDANLKLLILNRRHADELMAEDSELRMLLSSIELEGVIQLVTGFLEPDALVEHVAAADVVALPFELVPADAPLSLLEAHALGKPIVTTTVASLPEMASNGASFLATPGDVESLANALLQAANATRAGTRLAQTQGGLPIIQTEAGEDGQGLPRLLETETIEMQQARHRSWAEVGTEWSQLIHAICTN